MFGRPPEKNSLTPLDSLRPRNSSLAANRHDPGARAWDVGRVVDGAGPHEPGGILRMRLNRAMVDLSQSAAINTLNG
jgi:hypothetical protein